jgi:hypothetical protein
MCADWRSGWPETIPGELPMMQIVVGFNELLPELVENA